MGSSACCCKQDTVTNEEPIINSKGMNGETDILKSIDYAQHATLKADGIGTQTEDISPYEIRTDWQPSRKISPDWKQGSRKVAIGSGGGYGHFPAHYGVVGKGMLTFAVTGPYYKPPTAKQIVKAIELVTGKISGSQVLLIVKNYESDIEEFSKAAEICKNKYNIQIEIIIVKDNCDAKEQGVAGTILVHKVAGYLSERNKSLLEIKSYLNKNILPHLASIGIAKAYSKKFELGIGIHAEKSNLENVDYAPVDKFMEPMFQQIWNKYDANSQKIEESKYSAEKPSSSAQRVVVFLNNLRGQEGIWKDDDLIKIMGHILQHIQETMSHLKVERVFYGTYMTSLGPKGIKNGFSVTILRIVDDKVLDALDSVVEVDIMYGSHRALSVSEFRKHWESCKEQANDVWDYWDYHTRDESEMCTITAYEDTNTSPLHSHLESQKHLQNH